MNTIIELEHIWADYDKRNVLKDISLTVAEHDFIGVIGPNGGGKTTLMKVLLGLMKPSQGIIKYAENGHAVEQLNIGYLPQYAQIDKKFPICVEEVILSGLSRKKSLLQRYTEKDMQRVQEVIRLLGLSGLEKQPIGQLSGGQLQRAFLGRALVAEPTVIVLDEPNTYLDKEGEMQLYTLLQELNKKSAIILVSHDRTSVERYAKRIIYVSENLEIIK